MSDELGLETVAEPVAVMYPDGTVLSKADCGIAFEICRKVNTPLYTAPPHDAELVELLRESKTWIDNNSCHGTDAIDLMSRIDAKLASLRKG